MTQHARATRALNRVSKRPPSSGRFHFDRHALPIPADYYAGEALALRGGGQWRDAVCPFHEDHSPSLRVRIETGAFRCMVCGARGGDVLAFHMLRYGLSFKDAAKALGAWRADHA